LGKQRPAGFHPLPRVAADGDGKGKGFPRDGGAGHAPPPRKGARYTIPRRVPTPAAMARHLRHGVCPGHGLSKRPAPLAPAAAEPPACRECRHRRLGGVGARAAKLVGQPLTHGGPGLTRSGAGTNGGAQAAAQAGTGGAPGDTAVRADVLLINGRIWPGGRARTMVEALAIWRGRVLALGPTAELRSLAGPDTRVIDLGGRTAIPGF